MHDPFARMTAEAACYSRVIAMEKEVSANPRTQLTPAQYLELEVQLASIEISSAACRLSLARVYHNVDFERAIAADREGE